VRSPASVRTTVFGVSLMEIDYQSILLQEPTTRPGEADVLA
jgi:hypothetical protein